jgi:hypothetical protein
LSNQPEEERRKRRRRRRRRRRQLIQASAFLAWIVGDLVLCCAVLSDEEGSHRL